MSFINQNTGELVPHSELKRYDEVALIEAYPDFIAIRIYSKTKGPNQRTVLSTKPSGGRKINAIRLEGKLYRYRHVSNQWLTTFLNTNKKNIAFVVQDTTTLGVLSRQEILAHMNFMAFLKIFEKCKNSFEFKTKTIEDVLFNDVWVK
ncbi:Orf87 [Heliothis zea nudivirus]|uniref:Uncharacterized protein n=2 Tax=Betanudivirus hezeae TaxID=3052000 RepID=G9I080_HZNV2|nr:Orf87 [Heliothis zea nudivirus]YP_004956802.1 orf54 gene product [Helicoverpa zea nudivirus 2]AAN04381.1 Orf87 [Heliothis zea nudivirus]AEW69603.1 hypothetical protein Hz2V054 [Helicoverpa zea nudivirus 2]WCZ68534.1 hypothetical protein HvNV054 [Heliothis virescens nudivirus]